MSASPPDTPATAPTPTTGLRRQLRAMRQAVFGSPVGKAVTLLMVGILIVVLAFNLVGEGLRDAMNPKLRKRAS